MSQSEIEVSDPQHALSQQDSGACSFQPTHDWRWQMRQALRELKDFQTCFTLSPSESAAFEKNQVTPLFQIRVTPYYANLVDPELGEDDPIRRIFMPRIQEFQPGIQEQLDPLGEKQNLASSRLIHRYSDRVLFLVTDTCGVYCRYCTRKHFTGQDAARISEADYKAALGYIQRHSGIREVILSGGDPLTLTDKILFQIVSDLRAIPHVEMIRIGSRMPVVNPFRLTVQLAQGLQPRGDEAPIFLMTHFNHPRELTAEARSGIANFVNHGIPVMNQMVLLNGVNNHPAIVQALSRRLIRARAKPYYMFQCDPSEGTDHLRTSIENSLEIQRALWGHLSGLAMPTFAVDIPSGGGKTALVPNFQTEHVGTRRVFEGWDGVKAEYVSPPSQAILTPADADRYEAEWQRLRNAKSELS